MNQSKGDYYAEKFNRVFDFIDKNLEQNISLDDLASISNFSKFHFSRIFSAKFGESPFNFISRIRLEKIKAFLLLKPTENVSDIAYNFGFNDPAVFSRQFKSHFGLSPTAYRKEKLKDSNKGQIAFQGSKYFCSEQKRHIIMKQLKEQKVANLPEMTIAYLQHFGAYRKSGEVYGQLFGKLLAWAGKNDLLKTDPKSIVIHYDDPTTTPDEKQRMRVCITIPSETNVNGEIGKTTLPSGKYFVGRFELKTEDLEKAWNWIYGEWLPKSGYKPADNVPFQMYPEEPKNGDFVIDFCVPIEKM